MDILTTIQGVQANYVELNTKFTRIYDAFRLVVNELNGLKKRGLALEAALAALGVSTITINDGIEILVNGVSIGSTGKLNLEGDDEITVTAQNDLTNQRVNVFIELETLAQRFQTLVAYLTQEGFELPNILESDIEKGVEEES